MQPLVIGLKHVLNLTRLVKLLSSWKFFNMWLVGCKLKSPKITHMVPWVYQTPLLIKIQNVSYMEIMVWISLQPNISTKINFMCTLAYLVLFFDLGFLSGTFTIHLSLRKSSGPFVNSNELSNLFLIEVLLM